MKTMKIMKALKLFKAIVIELNEGTSLTAATASKDNIGSILFISLSVFIK